MSRAASTSGHAPATAISARDAAASAYPVVTSGLRFDNRSDHAPAMNLRIDATASAAPSIRPTTSAEAPRVEVRNTGRSG